MWEAGELIDRDTTAGTADPAAAEAGGRILIVDDDPHFLRVLQRILSGEKFTVTATSDPCGAISLFRSNNFDLIICDLRMPDCDGLNLLQAIRGTGNENSGYYSHRVW